MVKASHTAYKKGELIQMMVSATTSKERNRSFKLLKKFEPTPKYEMDAENDPKNFRPKECYRCDKPKQSKIKVQWYTTQGVKIICNACYGYLYNNRFNDQNSLLMMTSSRSSRSLY